MFTGIVETTGRVLALRRRGGEARLRIGAPFAGALRRSGSVAVDGVCLTVAGRGRGWLEFDIAPETLGRTTIGLLRRGAPVNLERPLRLGDPLGGHLVQGHVDGVGVVEAVAPEGSGLRLRVAFPAALGECIVEKGSIAVDGVSLTVAARLPAAFEVALIPETLARTHLGACAPGTPVNLEVDVMGRYVVEFLKRRDEGRTAVPVTRAHLERHGFQARGRAAR